MAKTNLVTLGLYGVLAFAGYQLAQSGAIGAKAQAWAGSFRAGFQTSGPGGAGQSQSSGTTGGSPSTQAPPSGQNQQQSSNVTAIRDNNSPGYPGNASAGPSILASFVNQYGMDPSDQSSPWVQYYRQQFGSWPADDLISGNTDPAGLYNYAVNALSYLQSIGAA